MLLPYNKNPRYSLEYGDYHSTEIFLGIYLIYICNFPAINDLYLAFLSIIV